MEEAAPQDVTSALQRMWSGMAEGNVAKQAQELVSRRVVGAMAQSKTIGSLSRQGVQTPLGSNTVQEGQLTAVWREFEVGDDAGRESSVSITSLYLEAVQSISVPVNADHVRVSRGQSQAGAAAAASREGGSCV